MQLPSLRALLAAFLLAVLAPGAGAAELVVIVSARNPVGALSVEQVADIGAVAVALDQGVGAPLRNQFYAKVTARSPALLKAYWSKMIFTGRGQPPREAPGSSAVRKLVADNPDDQAIALGHRLNLRVIAEGVETEQQRSFLRANDCDEMQGYLFSRPLPPDEVAALLRAQA